MPLVEVTSGYKQAAEPDVARTSRLSGHHIHNTSHTVPHAAATTATATATAVAATTPAVVPSATSSDGIYCNTRDIQHTKPDTSIPVDPVKKLEDFLEKTLFSFYEEQCKVVIFKAFSSVYFVEI